jgi:hypothetical protein
MELIRKWGCHGFFKADLASRQSQRPSENIPIQRSESIKLPGRWNHLTKSRQHPAEMKLCGGNAVGWQFEHDQRHRPQPRRISTSPFSGAQSCLPQMNGYGVKARHRQTAGFRVLTQLRWPGLWQPATAAHFQHALKYRLRYLGIGRGNAQRFDKSAVPVAISEYGPRRSASSSTALQRQ